MRTPRLHRVGPGVYDSDDGRVTLYRIEGVNPPAWNVEWTVDYQNYLVDHDLDVSRTAVALALIVDGAGTKKTALQIFGYDWPWYADQIARIEEGASVAWNPDLRSLR
jgi:hypothetical protein